jgi:hypothetical protein
MTRCNTVTLHRTATRPACAHVYDCARAHHHNWPSEVSRMSKYCRPPSWHHSQNQTCIQPNSNWQSLLDPTIAMVTTLTRAHTVHTCITSHTRLRSTWYADRTVHRILQHVSFSSGLSMHVQCVTVRLRRLPLNGTAQSLPAPKCTPQVSPTVTHSMLHWQHSPCGRHVSHQQSFRTDGISTCGSSATTPSG